jgi:hypothetical protein
MPLKQQAVLLRVIQERRMTRIGGVKVITVDVRLICATQKNLLEKVRRAPFARIFTPGSTSCRSQSRGEGNLPAALADSCDSG